MSDPSQACPSIQPGSKLKPGDKILVASHNQGKLREIKELLTPFGLEAVSAAELDLPEPVEDGESFAANAQIKALAACKATGLAALSDDSGLEVAALDGAPGIYSARWAGTGKDFAVAMEKVEQALKEKGASSEEARRANFTCALCLALPGDGSAISPTRHVYEGKVFGHLVWPPRGEKGFGYDPVFMADGYSITFGEMEPEEKHKISHRAKAFELFMADALPARQD